MCCQRSWHPIEQYTASFVLIFLPLLTCFIYPLTVSRQYYNTIYSNSLQTPTGGCQLVQNKQFSCLQYKCCNIPLGLHDIRGDECHLVSEDKTGFWQGRFGEFSGTPFWESTDYSEDDCSYVGESVCATYNVSLALSTEQMNMLEEDIQSQLLTGWVMKENQWSYKNISTNVLMLNHETGQVTLPLGTVFTSQLRTDPKQVYRMHPGASAGNGSPLQILDLKSGKSINPYIFQSFMFTVNVIDVKQKTYNDCKYVFERKDFLYVHSTKKYLGTYFQVLLAPSALLDDFYLLTGTGEKLMLLMGGIFGGMYLMLLGIVCYHEKMRAASKMPMALRTDAASLAPSNAHVSSVRPPPPPPPPGSLSLEISEVNVAIETVEERVVREQEEERKRQISSLAEEMREQEER
jgi:hypothetical protein